MKETTNSHPNKTNPLAVFKDMEAQAKARGLSAPQFLVEEHPEIADIMRRMIKAELAHRRANPNNDPQNCERCKLLNV